MPSQSQQMLRCTITLVPIKSIFRIELRQPDHFMISGNLGKNRGRTNTSHQIITANYGLRRTIQSGQSIPVNINQSRPMGQTSDRPSHGEKSRLQDIEFVDFVDICAGDTPGNRATHDFDCQFFSHPGGKLFGVPNALDHLCWIENDSRSKHRACQRTAPGLINACHQHPCGHQ